MVTADRQHREDSATAGLRRRKRKSGLAMRRRAERVFGRDLGSAQSGGSLEVESRRIRRRRPVSWRNGLYRAQSKERTETEIGRRDPSVKQVGNVGTSSWWPKRPESLQRVPRVAWAAAAPFDFSAQRNSHFGFRPFPAELGLSDSGLSIGAMTSIGGGIRCAVRVFLLAAVDAYF
jgi:hypothetical protein